MIADWAKRNLRSFYPVIVIFALLVFFTARNPNFATLNNMVNIGQQSSILLLVSLAGTFIILIGSIDLSVGAVLTLAGVIAGLIINEYGIAPALAVATATGVLVGLINGSTMIVLKVPSFLVTLGTMSILTGITNMICNGSSIILLNYTLTDFVNARVILGIPNIVVVTLLIAFVLILLSYRTVLGRHFYAIGGGEKVAASSGVRVTRVKIIAFMLSGGLSALAGVLLAAQVGAATPVAGSSNMLLDSIAAIVMGGTALSGGIGGPHRTILGVLVIALLSNGMDVTEVNSFTQQVVKGLVIILAVASTIDRRKYQFIK